MFENYKRFNFWLYTEIYEKITFDIDRKEGIRTENFKLFSRIIGLQFVKL